MDFSTAFNGVNTNNLLHHLADVQVHLTLILWIKGGLTPTSFGPNFQTFQFDPNQHDRCETSSRPWSGPNSRTVVRPKEVVSVRIKLNHGSVCVQCESITLKGSDLRTNDRKLQQATWNGKTENLGLDLQV